MCELKRRRGQREHTACSARKPALQVAPRRSVWILEVVHLVDDDERERLPALSQGCTCEIVEMRANAATIPPVGRAQELHGKVWEPSQRKEILLPKISGPFFGVFPKRTRLAQISQLRFVRDAA